MAPKKKSPRPACPTGRPKKLRLGCPNEDCPGELHRRYLNDADALQCNACGMLYLIGDGYVVPVLLTEH